jgi:hypothetical protein
MHPYQSVLLSFFFLLRGPLITAQQRQNVVPVGNVSIVASQTESGSSLRRRIGVASKKIRERNGDSDNLGSR